MGLHLVDFVARMRAFAEAAPETNDSRPRLTVAR
jgi:hypothetical protein